MADIAKRGQRPQILVEVRPRAGLEGDLGPSLPAKLLDRIDEIGESLNEIADRLSTRLDDLASQQAANEKRWRLREVEVTFSMDLESEVGVIVARTKATAGFEAKLTWRLGGE